MLSSSLPPQDISNPPQTLVLAMLAESAWDLGCSQPDPWLPGWRWGALGCPVTAAVYSHGICYEQMEERESADLALIMEISP